MVKLENNALAVSIAPQGAELKSVIDKQTGYEFMWQADPAVWPRTAPVLFPFVGKCRDAHYSHQGQQFDMGQHGFARDMEFSAEESGNEDVVFVLKSDDNTLRVYPFQFELQLSFSLTGRTLTCGYTVKNTGKHEMLFSIGAHPGFNLPSDNMEDYVLEFNNDQQLVRHLLSNGLLSGARELINTAHGVLALTRELFSQDAIVLKNMLSDQVTLKAVQSNFSIQMHFPGFPFFGIWTKPGSERFLCLEPWCGIADRVEGYPDLSQKEGINALKPGEIFTRQYSMIFVI